MFTGRTLSRIFRRHNKTRRKPMGRFERCRLNLVPLEDRRVPATITVTGNSDAIGVDGVCSLREAINAINNAGVGANSDVVANTTGTYGVSDSIAFAGDYTISVNGHMIISKAVTITGTGETKTVLQNAKAAGVDSRIFNTSDTTGFAAITLESMTLKSGNLTSGNNGAAILNVDENITCNTVTFSGNKTVGSGAVIATTGASGKVTLTGCTVTGNSAGATGGAFNWAGASVTFTASGTTFSNNTASSTGGVIHCAGGSSTIVITNCTFSSNTSTGAGTAINLAAVSTVSLTSSTFSLNSANSSAGAINAASGASSISIDSCTFSKNTGTTGGALAVNAASATFDIKNSSFENNRATSSGGVLYTVVASNIKMTNSSFTTNTVTGTGIGGVMRLSSTNTTTLTVDSCSFSGNTAANGAVVYFTGGTVGTWTISNSTFSKNTATTNAGALYILGSNTIAINNSTFSDNTAGTSGGAIHTGSTSSTTLNINNSTLVYNTATTSGIGGGIRRGGTGGTHNIISSIIAGNSATTGPDYNAPSAVIIGGGANLIGVADVGNFTLSTTKGTNYTGVATAPLNPNLNALGNSGGPTDTHVPMGTSKAVAKGNQNSLTLDQRGISRPSVNADIGSVQGTYLFPIPAATLGDVTVGGGSTYDAVVVYSDETGVDTASIGVLDVTLDGDGYGSPINATTYAFSGPATKLSVTYTFDAAPGPGTWDTTDNGSYTVTLVDSQVFDTDTPTVNAALAGDLGTFKVAIPQAWTVDDATDNDDSIYTANNFSLREAIRLANTATGTQDTITFGGLLTSTTTLAVSFGELSITDSVIIDASSLGGITIDAAGSSRIFSINKPSVQADVQMKKLTLNNGMVTVTGGGAIMVTSDKLTLTDCVVTNNIATGSGGAVLGVSGFASGTHIVLTNSTFSGNSASGNGGAVNAGAGGALLQVTNCTFTGNTAGGSGGATGGSYSPASSYFRNSTFSSNRATNGGASEFFQGSPTFENCTLSDNTATTNGGAIMLNSSSGTLTLRNVTIAGNSATTNGGGIARTTSGWAVNMNHSIVATNKSATTHDFFFNAATTVTTNYSLVGVANVGNGTYTGTGNLTGTAAAPFDPMIGPLANNGGPTLTHGLYPGSPAWNAGDTTSSFTYDQRGGDDTGPLTDYARVLGSNVDMGAFEGLLPTPTAKATVTINPVVTAGATTYTVSVVYSDDLGMDTASITPDDITISGPGYGSPQGATTVNYTGPLTSVTATYEFPTPAPSWDDTDNGVYTVTLGTTKVSDADTPTANSVAGGDLTTFSVAIPTTHIVSELGDLDDLNYGDDSLTLREAIKLANGVNSFDSITFKATLNGLPIILTGELAISDSVKIIGNGKANTIIDGGSGGWRIFNIGITGSGTVTMDDLTLQNALLTTGNGPAILSADESLTLKNLTITGNKTNSGAGGAIAVSGGKLEITSSTLSSNSATSTGGAIQLSAATTVTLTSSTFTLNSAGSTGGVLNAGTGVSSITVDSCSFTSNNGTSGGVFNLGIASTTLDAKNSTFTNNRASTSGGAVNTVSTSTVALNQNTFTTNTATTSGGAIRISSSNTPSFSLSASSFSGNTSGVGGAIYFAGHSSGTAVINTSTFSKNTANTNGGAIMGAASTPLTVNNSTFSNNTANGNTSTTGGGAIYASSTMVLIINNSTLVYNTATGISVGGAIRRATTTGSTTIISSIVAGNSAGTGADMNVSGAVTIGGGANLVGVSDAGNFTLDTTAGINQTGFATTPLDPLLGPLQNNGGNMLTHALFASSKALDNGNQNGLTTDQVGNARPAVGADIGAFEGILKVPSASATMPATITTSGGSTFTIDVVYTDETGIDTTTIDVNDLTITGPGYVGSATPTVAPIIAGPVTSVTVTYQFNAAPYPAGTWDGSDNGIYTVTLGNNQIEDDDTPTINYAFAGSLGTFAVAIPTTHIVSELGDLDDGFYGDDSLTLREALKLANNVTGTIDTILFKSTLDGLPIILTGEKSITDSVIIKGNGAGKTIIDGGAAGRVFNINVPSVGSVSMSFMKVTGGASTTGRGAGILSNDDNLTLDNMWIDANSTTSGAGAGVGFTLSSKLVVTNSTISGNITTTGSGGGIYMPGGASTYVLVRNSTISGNQAGGSASGGAIRISTTAGATVRLWNSTITGNQAGGTGGGISGTTTGGAITWNIESSIIAGNVAVTNNGNDMVGPTITALNSFIGTGNDSHTLTATGTTIFGSKATPADAQLAVLTGSPIPTHMPNIGSPVRDIGSNPSPTVTFDQLGTARSLQFGVDMGAIESVDEIPKATMTAIPIITVAGATPNTVVVTFKDFINIDHTTILKSAITILDPSSSTINISTVTLDAYAPGQIRVATFTFDVPGTTWDAADNGLYTVNMKALEVYDLDTPTVNSVAASTLGTFRVAVGKAIVVDEATDDDDTFVGLNQLSIREAINMANLDPFSPDVITFGGAAFAGDQTILVDGGEMSIVGHVTIDRSVGAKVTIDAGDLSRIFNINDPSQVATVTMNGLTLTKGKATSGGAILLTSDRLVMNNVVVSTSTATGGNGGGISVVGNGASGSAVIFTNVTLTGNSSSGSGGAIDSGGGGALVQFTNSTLSGNTAGGNGGGFAGSYLSSAVSFFRNSTFSGNKGTQGGGAGFYKGSPVFENTTISGNIASTNGGGIWMNSTSGTLTLRNVTITENSATTNGGGIARTSTGWNVNMTNSIVAKNINASTPDISFNAAYTVTGDHNLIGVSNKGNGTYSGPNNKLGFDTAPLDPLLGPLQNNGGPTFTHAPSVLLGSQAINNGESTTSFTYDQRGGDSTGPLTDYARLVGSNVDIGAYEVQPAATVTKAYLSDASGLPVNHRSLVKTLVVTFSTPVNFTAGAFTLFRSLTSTSPGANDTVALTPTPASGPTGSVTLTFSGALTEFGSLIDGIYDFSIDATKVTTPDGDLDGDGNSSFGGNYVVAGSLANQWFRYFGDFANDQTPSPPPPPLGPADGSLTQYVDFIEFRNAFTSPSLIFDFDNDGSVDQDDFIKFRNNFGGAP